MIPTPPHVSREDAVCHVCDDLRGVGEVDWADRICEVTGCDQRLCKAHTHYCEECRKNVCPEHIILGLVLVPTCVDCFLKGLSV